MFATTETTDAPGTDAPAVDVLRAPPAGGATAPRTLTAVPEGVAEGIAVGTRVAVETPHGIMSGRIIGAETENLYHHEWRPDDTAPLDATPLWRRTGTFRPYALASRETRLRLRIDDNSPPGAGAGAGGLDYNPLTRRTLELEQQQIAGAATRAVTQQREGDAMAMLYRGTGLLGTATTAVGLTAAVATAAAATDGPYTAYTNTATTVSWSTATTESILESIARIRAEVAATATTPAFRPSASMWYGAAGGGVCAVNYDTWGWQCDATGGGWEMTLTTRDSAYRVASGDAFRPKKPEDRLRAMIRDRMAPAVIGRARDPHANPTRPGLQTTDDFRELRARETLEKVIGSDKFRRFLRDGFVTCRARSGRTYQIFTGGKFTRVFFEGKEEPRLCVVLRGSFPPTDSLIVRYLLILNDEEQFRSLAVNQGISASRPARRDADSRSLADLYAGYKKEYAPYNKNRPVTAEPVAAAG